jgi:Sigma-70 factor, region 1.1
MGLRYGTLKMDPHEAALSDLISLARRRGSLTMEDLRKALPVDSMTVVDLSHALTRLDQAGFDLEIDPTLLLSFVLRQERGQSGSEGRDACREA